MNPTDIKQIGKWQVVRLIGQGGMSWVFEVVDPRLGATRAAKMMKPAMANTAGYKGFLREARILASIDDDFLVRIYDLDQDPATGYDYYVMELLSGSDLKQTLKREGALPPQRVVEVFAGVLQALGRLHAQSPPIIHRDIKPGNIQITESGRPKLLDLGIAKVTRKSAEETVFDNGETLADMFKGTVLYAAPEHLAMQEPGPQADVFAMGLCIYEALEGRHAYAGVDGLPDPTSSHVSYQDVFRFYTRLEAVQGRLKVAFKRTPKALQPVIQRALEIDPSQRFRDANEMRAALLQPDLLKAADTIEMLGRPAAATPAAAPRPRPAAPAPRQPARAPADSRRWVAIAATAVAAAGIAGLTYALWPTSDQGRLPEPKPPAEQEAHATQPSPVQPAPTPPQTLPQPSASEAATPSPSAPQTSGSVAAVLAARARAEKLAAATNAPDDWQRATAAQEAERFDEASDAFDAASDKSQAALASARQLLASAESARKAFPADCAGSAACREGDAALSQGKLALDRLAATEAADRFRSASKAFAAIPPSPKARLEVSVSPSGPLALEVGVVQRFQATTKPAGATVKYSVQPPNGGTPYTVSGNTYAFVPGQFGEYRISVIATDPGRPQSVPVVIVATARAKAENTRPSLELTPTGTLQRRVGEVVTFEAHATDEFGKAAVQYKVAKPQGAPELPKSFQDKGGATTLSFTPTVPGTYAFTFWAYDVQGQESDRKSATVVVRAADAANATPAADEGADALADAKGLLRQFRLAIENRDMSRLRAVWKIDAESADGFQHLFDSADDIKVVADPLGPIQPRGGDKGELRFRQRVTTTIGGEAQDIVPLANYRAELLRRGGSWQILGMKQE